MKVRLGDVCEIINGFAFKSENYVSDGIRIIRIANVQKGYIEDSLPCYYPLEQKNNLCRYMLYEGDLLLSLTGNVGRVALLHRDMLPAALNQRVACLRLKRNDILIKYLFHFMNSDKFEQDCVDSSKGIAQKNMSTEWLKEYVLNIPTVETQQKEICVFDKICALIEKRKQQLEKLDLLVKSKFIEMFGDPMLNPYKWEMATIGDIATEIRYGTSRPAVVGGKYPYLRMNNLTFDGHLDLSELKYIDIPKNEIEKCIVRKGDILFNRTNSVELVGKTCVFTLDEDMVIAGYIIRVRINKQLLPIFLSSYMNSNTLKKLLKNMAKGAVNQANINAQELQEIKIYLPPIELQNEFASFVERTDKTKSKIKQSLEKFDILKKALMQKYFG